MPRLRIKRILFIVIFTATFYTVFQVFNTNRNSEKVFMDIRRFVWRNIRMKYQDRKHNLENKCRRLKLSNLVMSENEEMYFNKTLLNHIIVDDTSRFMYCDIPRAASTNWKRMILFSNGQLNVTNPADLGASQLHTKYKHSFRKLSEYPEEEIRFRVNTYFKFMFTRTPFERLASTYRNKFAVRNPVFYRSIARKILRRHHRKRWDNSTLVAIEDFIKFIIRDSNPDSQTCNVHWCSYTHLCQPCDIKYDVIGRFDSFEEDKDFIMLQTGFNNFEVKFPPRSQHYRETPTNKVLRRTFSSVSNTDIIRLWEVYWKDFLLFDYKMPDFGRPYLQRYKIRRHRFHKY